MRFPWLFVSLTVVCLLPNLCLAQSKTKKGFVTPLIEGYGPVIPLPNVVQQPQTGTKVVFDITANKEPKKVLAGLERVAVLMNLAYTAGVKGKNIEVVLVLHGSATDVALNSKAFAKEFGYDNPSVDLIRKLKKAGVKLYICGQSLSRKGYDFELVSEDFTIASSAMAVCINYQKAGFAYLPVH